MHLFSHQTTELSDVLGNQADRLLERLSEARDWQTRFLVVDEFLVSRIRRSEGVPIEIEWAWRQLEISHGTIPIQEIAKHLTWSRKRLITAFREQIGIPPKTLGRVLRFRQALTELAAPNVLSVSQVAVDCGYSDQAHLIREFREFSGLTPVELLRSYAPDAGIIES
jgi:AraC-like DNA-binding protein